MNIIALTLYAPHYIYTYLLHLGEWFAADRVLKVRLTRFSLGHKLLFAHVVPAFIGVLVDITCIESALEDKACEVFVLLFGGANESVVADEQLGVQFLELGHVMVAQLNRRQFLFFGCTCNLHAVLICARAEKHISSCIAVISGNNILILAAR